MLNLTFLETRTRNHGFINITQIEIVHFIPSAQPRPTPSDEEAIKVSFALVLLASFSLFVIRCGKGPFRRSSSEKSTITSNA
ncbi:hypothetical protein O6P43_018067 [Quillaja saponaria]|uniref:Uncharacterized protein n=1 Tax=Quillaja saponaria TaxID=32244 RepID=A0AAD7PQ03_QUISA|nr:hypothetical protein O6P43_018067 [Quillaja saponaria]